LLRNGEETREALWVCEASGDRELMALARAFRNASEPEKADRPTGFGHTGFGTTEFGVSGFASTEFATTEFGETAVGELVEDRSAPRGSWFGKLNALLPR
jgi:hypothetical protein